MRRRGLAGMVLSIVACAVLVVVVVVGDGVVWYLRSTVADGEFCASRVVEGVENRREAVAWLRVDGTGIDAPVMQRVGDDDFYLSHDADGVLDPFGALFIEGNNHASFDDLVTVVYGHALVDGALFGSLARFSERSFFDTHKRIEVCTSAGGFMYEVVAAFRWGNVWLFDEFSLTDVAGVREYVQGLATRARLQGGLVRDFSFDVDGGRLLVLSTCDQRDGGQRFLVHAVRVEADDE